MATYVHMFTNEFLKFRIITTLALLSNIFVSLSVCFFLYFQLGASTSKKLMRCWERYLRTFFNVKFNVYFIANKVFTYASFTIQGFLSKQFVSTINSQIYIKAVVKESRIHPVSQHPPSVPTVLDLAFGLPLQISISQNQQIQTLFPTLSQFTAKLPKVITAWKPYPKYIDIMFNSINTFYINIKYLCILFLLLLDFSVWNCDIVCDYSLYCLLLLHNKLQTIWGQNANST